MIISYVIGSILAFILVAVTVLCIMLMGMMLLIRRVDSAIFQQWRK